MSVALIFAGQGGQHAGMLAWLEDDDLLASLRQRLNVPDWRAAMANPAWSAQNHNAQVLITATALSAWRQIAPGLPALTGVAGYSVGELAAFSAAGTLDPPLALDLASTRAHLMDQAAMGQPGGLLGVTGLPQSQVATLLVDPGLGLAIANGADRVVVGGPLAALVDLERAASRLGARCTRLPVAVASHTPQMQPAAEAFAALLGSAPVSPPRRPLFSNVLDRIWSAEDARTALARQIATTVHWDRCMDQIAERAPGCVLEIGGGQALAQLWNQRHPAIPARSADEFRTKAGLLDWVARRGAR